MLEAVRSNRLYLALAVVVLLVAVALAYRGYNYVQHDPAFCTSCHTMSDAYERWSSSVHSEITCHECHTQSISANLNQLWLYWRDRPDEVSHTPEVQNTVCYRCHSTGEEGEGTPADEQWRQVLSEAGHAWHVGKQKIQCIRCHSTDLHTFVPPVQICKECHKHETLDATGMRQHCTACHPFKATGRDNLLPKRQDCLACHQAMQVGVESFPDENAPMHWDCRQCHKPHQKEFLESEDCRGCHEGMIGESPIHKVATHQECTNCHKPHSWKIDPETSCLNCHPDRKEHAGEQPCNLCHK